MAIQVGGTTVIDNSRVLQNISGLKTVGGTSILGSGDIAVGGGGNVRAAGRVNGTIIASLGSSTYDRLYVGVFDYRYGRTGTWTGSGVGYFFRALTNNSTGPEVTAEAPTSFTLTSNYSDTQRYHCHFYLGAGRGISTTQGTSQTPPFYGIYLEFDN